MEKYKLTDETIINYDGRTLFRIIRIVDEVKGGFIEKEDNLSQFGNAWVSENARVSGNAWVYGDAILRLSEITKTTDYLLYGPIGSRNSVITICKEQNQIMTGCFCGSKEEFLESVQSTHGNNEHAQNYRRLIGFVFGSL
jgi:hypothetical protein